MRTKLYLVTKATRLGAFGMKVVNGKRSIHLSAPASGETWGNREWVLFYKLMNCGNKINLNSFEVGTLRKMAQNEI